MKAFTAEELMAMTVNIECDYDGVEQPGQCEGCKEKANALRFAALMAEQQEAAGVEWDEQAGWFNKACVVCGGCTRAISTTGKWLEEGTCRNCHGTGRVHCARLSK